MNTVHIDIDEIGRAEKLGLGAAFKTGEYGAGQGISFDYNVRNSSVGIKLALWCGFYDSFVMSGHYWH